MTVDICSRCSLPGPGLPETLKAQFFSFGDYMRDLRIHVVLPVQVRWPQNASSFAQPAYTIDVSQRGARLAGVQGVDDSGLLITIRRRLSEAQFRVVWVGKVPGPQQGQIGVECVDAGKVIWDVDFRKVREDFEPIGAGLGINPSRQFSANPAIPASYDCNGLAKMWVDDQGSFGIEARLLALGFARCQLEPARDVPRDPILLELHVDGMELTVKGKACEQQPGPGTWIEFTHIRRGDHYPLQALLKRLRSRH